MSEYELELYHHGVKGMKWGIRRYQNKDGSLTPRGIKRYATKGYSKDAYNSNKTVLGKAYDKYSGAHKIAGEIQYGRSTKKQNQERAERYLKETDKTKNWSDDAKEVANIKKKKLNEMSNAELKKLTQRDELVNKYKKSNPSSIKKGIAFLGAAAGLMGTTLAIYNNTGPLINAGKDVGGKIIDKIGDFVIKDISKHL